MEPITPKNWELIIRWDYNAKRIGEQAYQAHLFSIFLTMVESAGWEAHL